MNEQKVRRLVLELLAALDEGNGIDGPDTDQPIVKPVPVEEPRQANARAHTLDPHGRVMGVHVTVHEQPNSHFRCTNVFVRDEYAAQGQTIAHVYVRGRNRQLLGNPVILATGYGGGLSFDDYLTGQGQLPEVHPITAKFSPPNLGPLAIFVAKPGTRDRIDSDVVASLGLPYGHHVSYVIEFMERE